VKVWDARTGKPVRVMKDVFAQKDNEDENVKQTQSEITSMSFDEHHRRLLIGDSLGHVKVFDIQSGVMTHELERHGKDDGEISYIGYGGEDQTIITVGWDKTIKVHSDDANEIRKPAEKVLRGAPNTHGKDVISADYAHYLGFIATGSRDNTVKVWDYERILVQHTITAHQDEVNVVKFLKPFPLLLTADQSGLLYIWLIKPKVNEPQLVLTWRNLKSIMEQPPITAVDVFYQREKD
jgi:WD40 repeat protein